MTTTRADLLAVARGLVPSRSAAARLIEGGGLRVRRGSAWQLAKKSGELVDDDCALEIADDAELRFVSRGGLKLEAALDRVGLDVAGRFCLDIGQSTGGFTDVLLARGAAHVVGVDVGHGQLHPRLRSDARVTALESVNARQLGERELARSTFDLVVADLSFISLTLVLPALAARIGGAALLLVKPQFELQPADIGKGGIVRDAAAQTRVETRLRAACAGAGLSVHDYFPSPIAGGDGNREFFVHATRRDTSEGGR